MSAGLYWRALGQASQHCPELHRGRGEGRAPMALCHPVSAPHLPWHHLRDSRALGVGGSSPVTPTQGRDGHPQLLGMLWWLLGPAPGSPKPHHEGCRGAWCPLRAFLGAVAPSHRARPCSGPTARAVGNEGVTGWPAMKGGVCCWLWGLFVIPPLFALFLTLR